MRITGPGRTSGPQTAHGARRAGQAASGFMPSAGESAARTATTTSPTTLGGLDALLALQSIDADQPKGGRRKAVRQGHDMLDALDEIKVGLLGGSLPPAALDRVATLIGGLEPSGDEELDALVSQIALRAEVEMAKLGRYLEQS